jgi:ribosomal-protein-alanine N-acetyltransferase
MYQDVTLRAVRPEEIPQVLAVENAAFDDPWPVEVFEAELRHSWSHCIVIEERETTSLLGHAVFWVVADEVHLLNLAVHPDARSRKLGRMLLGEVLQAARLQRARFITVEVRSSNSIARSLYESAGFKQVGVRPRYYASDGEDAVIMLYDLGSETGKMAAVKP